MASLVRSYSCGEDTPPHQKVSRAGHEFDDAEPVPHAAGEREAGMSGDLPFDPEAFLSKAGRGTTKSTYEEDQVNFFAGQSGRFNFLDQ